MSSFSTNVSANAIGFGVVWTGVLLFQYYYPPDIADDLKDVDLPPRVKEELLACAWEYTRCVVPEYTNWTRYVAFMRIIVTGTIAEFRGSLMDVANDDDFVGYKLTEVYKRCVEEQQARPRCDASFGASYSCRRKSLVAGQTLCYSAGTALLFRKAHGNSSACVIPDALARFTIGSALVCNDLDNVWFSDAQFDIMAEIGNTMYDGIAYWKHHSEGEINSTFAYIPDTHRITAYDRCREALWALDVAYVKKPEMKCALNFIRYFGGPIHMMMRRYRLVEEGLTIGKPETKRVIADTRKNVKLWNRVDEQKKAKDEERESLEQYRDVLSKEKVFLFNGLAEMLEGADKGLCSTCSYRETYGAPQAHTFGGVLICAEFKQGWGVYTESILERAVKTFPEVAETICLSETRATSSFKK